MGLEVLKDSGIDDMHSLMGPENSLAAKNQAPGSIRAVFGKDNLRNAIHGSDTPEFAARECDFFFNQGTFKGKKNCPTSAILTNCSLLLIKPHIIQSHQLGQVLDKVLTQGGFEISAIQMFYLNKATACEFFEVYKGVSQEFN